MQKKLIFVTVLLCFAEIVSAQSAQVGADRRARSADQVTCEYLSYRPAKWETEKVTEVENDFPNQGGMACVYFRNTSDKPVHLKFWRVNDQDESYWRMNFFIAWDRTYDEDLEPGELSVIEINSPKPEFGEGKPFEFQYVGDSWRPAMKFSGELNMDSVQCSYLRMLPDMKTVEAHYRYSGEKLIQFESFAVEGIPTTSTEWTAQSLPGPGCVIVRAALERPLEAGQLLVAKTQVRDDGAEQARPVYAHRRAYADVFPIGVWNSAEKNLPTLRRMHIDTVVNNSRSTEKFFNEDAAKYGFHAMAHTGLPTDVDRVRDLKDHPAVACWMIQDEPDFTTPPVIMKYENEALKRYDTAKPTFITLCRNVKFFEYAAIADIPCMDHYSVTAPSSSKWPKIYGTHLEETAWYTRDLKYASEPKGVWIWSQAIADWGERPKRPVPTPEELAAQVVLNLGRGAKGILWFNYSDGIADKYPDVREAMQRWGRVMELLRDDFLRADTATLGIEAPEKVDVAPLLGWDKLILCVTNTDYQIHPEAYPFVDKSSVELTVSLPAWIAPAATVRLSPDGVTAVPCTVENGHAKLAAGDLHDSAVFVLCNDPATPAAYQAAYETTLAAETREF